MPASQPSIYTFNIHAFGAVGDGVTDDTLAIQSAIDVAGIRGGGCVLIPPGDYLVKPQSIGGYTLVVRHSNITLQGVGRSVSRIIMRPYASIHGNHETNWQVINGKVWRGVLLTIVGGSPRDNVVIRALTIDGGCQYTGNVVYPANPTTGDGWDITHKGISMDSQTGSYERILIEDCDIYGFKGEIIYGGGGLIGSVTLRNSELHDTNGDCWSVSGRCTVIDNRMYRAAHACIEDVIPNNKPCYYGRNELYDCSVHHLVSFSGIKGQEDSGPTIFESNYLHNHSGQQSALFMTRIKNLTIRDNLFVDVAPNINTRAISLDSGQDTSVGVDIIRNTIVANNQNMNCGIILTDGAFLFDCKVIGNSVAVSSKGFSNKISIVAPYTFPAVITNLVLKDNLAQGIFI